MSGLEPEERVLAALCPPDRWHTPADPPGNHEDRVDPRRDLDDLADVIASAVGLPREYVRFGWREDLAPVWQDYPTFMLDLDEVEPRFAKRTLAVDIASGPDRTGVALVRYRDNPLAVLWRLKADMLLEASAELWRASHRGLTPKPELAREQSRRLWDESNDAYLIAEVLSKPFPPYFPLVRWEDRPHNWSLAAQYAPYGLTAWSPSPGALIILPLL